MSLVPGSSPRDLDYPAAIPFVLVHLGCLAVFWTGATWQAAALGITLYVVRIFGIGAAYHRYFSHRAFSTSRPFQFALAFLAQTSAQSSVLWWAARHREHHLHSDTQADVHSPRHHGVFYAHVGWIFDRRRRAVDPARVADLACFPELSFLARFEHAPALLLAVACFLLAGWPGLVIGFLWSTVAVYHATFCINSLAHTRGRQRYVTGDTSRNNALLAAITLGEGWHNNHHAYQSSVRQGFRWWEVDVTYLVLLGLSKLGLVWDLKTPPASVLQNEHRLGSRVIQRTADQLAEFFDVGAIAAKISAGRGEPELVRLRTALHHRRGRDDYAALVHLPTREQVLEVARTRLPHTPSLDAIVDGAEQRIANDVGALLVTRKA